MGRRLPLGNFNIPTSQALIDLSSLILWSLSSAPTMDWLSIHSQGTKILPHVHVPFTITGSHGQDGNSQRLVCIETT